MDIGWYTENTALQAELKREYPAVAELIAELEQQITRYREVIAKQASISAEHDVRMYAAEAQLSRYRSKYNNLLAVAHRDGGQYLAQHGEDAAGEDAITAILTAYHNNDCYQGAVEVEIINSEILSDCSHDYDAGIFVPRPYTEIGQQVKVLVMKEVE